MMPWEEYGRAPGPWTDYGPAPTGASADRYAAALKDQQAQMLAEMPWWQKSLAGAGKAFYDMGRGVGELLPGDLVSRKDIDEAKKLDAPLMDTGAGLAGNIVGNLVPAVLLPASTVPRALVTGAGMGFLQPVGTNDSRLANTIEGGAAGAAVPLALAGGRALYGAGRSVVEPVVAPQRTAARILEQFADDPQAMRLAAANATELVPGAKPTLAQVALQPGISTLERGTFNQPGPLQAGMTDRMQQQGAARIAALQDLAGTDGRLDFAKAARETTANDLYGRAFAEAPEDSTWIKGQVTTLMQRPAFVDALKDAQELAMNQGIKVSPKNPENTTQILHFAKLALDDKIEAATRAGNGNAARGLIDTKDRLVSLMESKGFSPSYREARDTFKQMSQPVNEMELAGGLLAKAQPAIEAETGAAPSRVLTNNLAAEARRRGAEIDRNFTPESRAKLQAVLDDLRRAGDAQALGKPTGSPTAQYLTTQNLMRQIAGPLGVPQGFADRASGALMATPVVGGALQFATKGAEQRVQQQLADLLLNPSTAASAFGRINAPPGALQRRLGQASPYLPALTSRGMFAYGGQQQ